ncbi:MAG: signal peptidase I [Defluviitaleaceae bacterium]|nr:signal peptidase I [Defluviitaleaceae bacterium]
MGSEAKSDRQREIIEWVKTILFAVIVAVFIGQVVIVNAEVPSGSMEDTIMTDSRVVAFRLDYLFNAPQRYDIVVFRWPDDRSQLFIKRVIGLPGETVSIRDGEVYITGADGVENPAPLDDSFILAPMYDEAPMTFHVPEGCYFMLGDNRNISDDSRRWNEPFVPKSDILGKAVFEYYPSVKMLYGK